METVVLGFAIASYIVFPAVALWVTEKVTKVHKLSLAKQAVLYLVTLITIGAAWGLSQIFIPLAIIITVLNLFVAGVLIAKLSMRSEIVFALVYTATLAVLVALSMLVAMAVLSPK